MTAPTPEFLDAALAVALKAADAAEAVVARHYRARVEVEIKADASPVTIADREAEQAILAILRAAYPDHAVYGEEYGRSGDSDFLWLVDPIDGTRDYIRGRSGWCVSVALIEGSEAVFAAIYAPVTAQLWVAHKGEGTTCNGKRLTASQRVAFSGARVPTDALPKIDRDLQMVHKPNSIAMRMTMVACDRADLVATLRWGNEWDIAAAHLIAEEAGAVVTSATGQPILYNKREPMDFGLICCAAGIHDAAVERLRERVAAILA